MKIKSNLFLIINFIFYQVANAQNQEIFDYHTHLNRFVGDFSQTVKDEDKWVDESREIKFLIDDAKEDLESKSGFGAEDKKELKLIKRKLEALYVVGQSINPDNYSHFNGQSLKLVQEMVYNLKMEYQFSELNVSVYKLQISDYIVYLFYYSDQSFSIRNIAWKKLNERYCGSIMGNWAVPTGVYKQFWNNSECLNKSYFKFKIIENSFKMDLSNMKYFYDDLPYTF
jgi:hypothetical protein